MRERESSCDQDTGNATGSGCSRRFVPWYEPRPFDDHAHAAPLSGFHRPLARDIHRNVAGRWFATGFPPLSETASGSSAAAGMTGENGFRRARLNRLLTATVCVAQTECLESFQRLLWAPTGLSERTKSVTRCYLPLAANSRHCAGVISSPSFPPLESWLKPLS